MAEPGAKQTGEIDGFHRSGLMGQSSIGRKFRAIEANSQQTHIPL
jgi:hypothetical protein